MSRTIPPRDPWAAYRREVVAVRRIGKGRKCTCGESRPEALIPGSNPMICARCDRIAHGRKTDDGHHVFGQAISPLSISIPVEDNRADLSAPQNSCPRITQASKHDTLFL